MLNIQALPFPLGLWLCSSLTVLISVVAGSDTPLMRHEKVDPLAALGGQSVGTGPGSKAKIVSTIPVMKKTFGNRNRNKATKDADVKETVPLSDNPDLGDNNFWNERLEIIRKAESKTVGEKLDAGEMVLVKVLDAVVPKDKRSKAMVSIGRDDKSSHGWSTHSVILPLLEELSYRGLVLQNSEAPSKKGSLEDQLSKVNGTGRVFLNYQNHIYPEGVGDLLRQVNMPKDLDVLKIDTDSYDLALLKGVLKHEFDPKIVIMEMNAELAPPINWCLEHNSSFVFAEKTASAGTYGASPDALYEELSMNQKYSLIGLDMQNGRHDMWFVKNSLVRPPSQADKPLLSWRGMVRMFWQQQVGHKCDKIPHHTYSCPLNFLREVYKEAHGVLPSNFSRDSWEQMADISIYLANPNFQKKDAPYGYVTLLNQALIGQCGSRKKSCKTKFKVMKDPSQDADMHDEEDDEEDGSLTAMTASRHAH